MGLIFKMAAKSVFKLYLSQISSFWYLFFAISFRINQAYFTGQVFVQIENGAENPRWLPN
jgi:hypothetical protein